MLMTATNNIIKGYWFQEGYIRTSSREFSIKNLENKMIHLTNDANYINLWIIKPGENTNRGNGIEVSSNIVDIRKLIACKESSSTGKARTIISNILINN